MNKETNIQIEYHIVFTIDAIDTLDGGYGDIIGLLRDCGEAEIVDVKIKGEKLNG